MTDTPKLYDTVTTAEQVHAVSETLKDIVVNSGISANVLHTMFSYYAMRMMEDIARISVAEQEKPDAP